MNKVTIHDKEFQLYISEEDIRESVKTLSAQIEEDYQDLNPLFVCVLNGSFIFAADLLRYISFDTEIQFVTIKSYDGLSSSGEIEIINWDESAIKNREVLIVEDIIDTGQTLNAFIPILTNAGAKSVKVVSLLLKPDALVCPIKVDYNAFKIPNKFVVGYGLDYNEKGRNLEGIYQLV